MAKDLIDWISRQAQISGDARQDLIRTARKYGWEMQSFAELICGEPSTHRELVDICSPFEIAVLSRAWRMDFGLPSPRKIPSQRRRGVDREHLEARQHYIGGHSHMYMLDDYVAADDDYQIRENAMKVISPPREAWSKDGYHQERRPVSAYGGWNEAAACGTSVSPDSQARPRVSFEGVSAEPAEDPKKEASPEPGDAEQETLEHPRVSKSASLALDDAAAAIVASAGAIFVAGRGGLKRFDLPDLQLMASEPYAGIADPPGYVDLAAGPGFIVCVDLDGCVYRYDALTCELQAKRAYQPSVMEHSQRIVACQLERSSRPIIGLEGGVGGASRLAASSKSVYLGGRDGVVTSYAAGTLSLSGRCRLQEGPASAALGIRAVFLSAYQRLYCAVLSSVYVLATPAMYQLARLRGGPRVPVFGSVSAVVESNAGDVAFVADVGGPSIHVWSTKSWQWLARVELSLGGGPARQLATANQVLYASTETERLMAFDFSKLPPKCILEGAGGGPLSTDECLVVLSKGQLHLQSFL